MYVQGFIIPVRAGRKQAYVDLATKVAPLFTDYGALRTVETWGVDVPDGERTDMRRAVQATGDEDIVFSWIVWADKAACDAAAERMMADDRMKPEDDMPLDGKRMIYAGFETVLDDGTPGPVGFVDGMVAAVPIASRQAYVDHATAVAPAFRRAGATRLVENWGIAVPEGTLTDFRRAVQAGADETVVFSWIEWPDRATRDAGMAIVMQDERLADMTMPFDGKRMIYGGFEVILDTGGDA